MRHAAFQKTSPSLASGYYFIKQRIIDALGLGLIAISLLLMISILTYDASDPSWNVAIDGPVRNMMGAEGAIIADIGYQTFGSLSYIIALTIGLWGGCLFAGRHLRLFWLRLILLPVWVVSLSITGQFMLLPFRAGFVGRLAARKIATLMGVTKISASIQYTAGGIFILLLISIIVIAGVTWSDIRRGFYAVKQIRHLLHLFKPKEKIPSISDHPYFIKDIPPAIVNPSTMPVKIQQACATIFQVFKRPAPTHPALYREPVLDGDDSSDEFDHQSDLKSLIADFDLSNRVDDGESADDQHLDFSIERSDGDDSAVSNALHIDDKALVTNKQTVKTSSVVAKVLPSKSVVLNLAKANTYQLPSHELLNQMPPSTENLDENDKQLQTNARQLMSVLEEFGVKGQITKVRPGPVVTLYELVPAAGIKTSRVVGLADDIARSMCAMSARISVVVGQNALGIEMPNANRQMVFLRELITNSYFDNPSLKLALALGKDISGNPVITDLARMPHLLVAGTTGSGKSVAINTMILSLLYCLSPDRCRFIMIDPKMLELSVYDGIPHLLTPVVTDPKKAIHALKWTVREMEDRYRMMSCLGVRNIEGYNARLNEAVQQDEVLTRQIQTGFDPSTGQAVYETQPLDMDALPYIVVVVDEMADLMMVAGKEIEAAVQRLAQMARAAGIHIIMATQRPSVDVITGTIKANFPTRISFQVTSRFDSRTILGEQGAEQLLGRGDMLFMEAGGKIQRVHGPFVSDREVEQVVHFLKQQKRPDYIDNITEDIIDTPLTTFKSEGTSDKVDQAHQQRYQQAVELIKREGKASTSFIQRHLRINYNNAARVIEQMEAEGLISPANHVGKREVYIHAH